jgi:hypothetical protein
MKSEKANTPGRTHINSYGSERWNTRAPSRPTLPGNFYTRRGHLLEDKAISLYQRIMGRSIARPGFVTSSDYPTCGYSPDGIDCPKERPGLCGNDTLLEVKCFNKARHLAIAGGKIPFEILAQIHFGLFICDIRKARLILYNPDFAKREIDGQPNPDYDPKKALVILNIRSDKAIRDNFRRILIKEVAHALRT